MNIQKVLIPVGLGVLAAAVNFFSLQASLRPVEFVRAKTLIQRGQVITAEAIEPAVAAARQREALRVTAPLFDDRAVLIGQRAARTIQPGDLVFYKDTGLEDVGAELDFRTPREAGLTVRLGKNTELAGRLRVGEEVFFRITEPLRVQPGGEQSPEPVYRQVGPFRLLAVGPEKLPGLRFSGDSKPVAQVTVAIDLTADSGDTILLEDFVDRHQRGEAEDPRVYPKQ